MAEHEVDVEAHDSALERLVMFSDGVFAIAITLLVIDLKVPEVPEANGAPDLGSAVWDMGPSFFAYILSFLVIGHYWQIHRRIFGYIVRSDANLTWLNIAYLMLVAFLPFPTAMRGDYEDSRFAIIFYAGTLVLIGLLSLGMWFYATHRRRLTRRDLADEVVVSGLVNGAIPIAIFLLSIGVAYIDTDLAPVTWIALVLTRPVRRRLVRRWRGPRLGAAHRDDA